ncbi:nucleoside-binding protein [Rhizobium sp. PP-F2F-G48]|uniref:BMP family ABC transporter substrate-binding protein n=1 Tax=Rhizobium sp. PP-F2F-G48 TaxID=2135651 RepID=UPI0010539923|nr:BMP family ABC transporter substrate-binding protein [Rhizobium sp. PP-F2F-G48]TCM52770.1 nucleoside-binding protein [Rhizobium sp. PP-F2F-G48]
MTRLKKAVILTAAASIFSASLASAAEFKVEGTPKAAIILFGPKNDGGWSQAFEEARPALEEALGAKIPMVEKVSEDAASISPPVERFIQRGYNVIIGTAFGYSDTFKKLSEAYPKVAFLNASGITNGPNLESFYGRTYQSQYLCGMAAAASSKTGKLGFVAANPLPVVNWTINAYELGAKAINPDATLTVVFTGAWNDPVKERAAASALIDEGIDVIGQHVDTPTPQIVAEERGVYGTGHHRDLTEFAAKATQCSSVWTWAKFLAPEIEKIKAGTWEPAPYGAFPGIKEGGTDITCCGPAVSEDNKKKIMAARQSIIDGNPVFSGPLKDRDGKERLAANVAITDAELWTMDWFVPGVISQK